MWRWLLPTLTGIGGAAVGFGVGTQFPTEGAATRKLSRVEQAKRLLAEQQGGQGGQEKKRGGAAGG